VLLAERLSVYCGVIVESGNNANSPVKTGDGASIPIFRICFSILIKLYVYNEFLYGVTTGDKDE
jgi:hypothetical protein